jgi:IS30 family transposase
MGRKVKNRTMRKGKKKHVARGEEIAASKLTEDKVRSIRGQVARGVPQAIIAKAFKMSPSAISRIVNRKWWKHIK